MRLSIRPMLAVVAVVVLACDEPLTGPDAQRADADATQRVQVVPEDRLVFVGGVIQIFTKEGSGGGGR